MFDLNDALKQWKHSFRGTCSVDDVEELASHLQELVTDLRDTGLPEEEAFAQAVTRMGAAKDLKSEFAKVNSWGDWVLDRVNALD